MSLQGLGVKEHTAAVIAIGNEILSGRTKDTNSNYIVEVLTNVGVDVCEIRVIPDTHDIIVDAVRTLANKFSYVFTTGGIGPTHDDITADAVAAAFDVCIDINDDAVSMMRSHYAADVELNEARLRMARIPFGASLIENTVSGAPGFRLGNVFVLAGVPIIMKAMLDVVTPTLSTGTKVLSKTLYFPGGEGIIATGLRHIQNNYCDVSIGSYPDLVDDKYTTKIVIRTRDIVRLDQAYRDIAGLITKLS